MSERYKDIDYALVEGTRPPIYTAMKYWGKKPHNIWRQYIENYAPEDSLFLDPFAGSAMSAFEAVKVGKKAIAFDINPLTTFLIETFCNKFDKNKFAVEVDKIINEVKSDDVYKDNFHTTCRKCGNDSAVAQNFKWEDGRLYEVGVECEKCQENKISRHLEKPIEKEIEKTEESQNIDIKAWYPEDEFHNSPSFTANFIRCLGGNRFSDLWTRRNLYVISKIFESIREIEDLALKNQLLLGFIKTIHLCSRMCVPRRKGANRGFSTSWGRSAYICAERSMEMNPLLVFYGSCIGKQSVGSALSSLEDYLGKIPKILYVDESNRSNRSKNFDIKYGIIDINTVTDFVGDKSVDFIMTDPPYGGLVQYLDLSTIWLVWLKKVDKRFTPDYTNEITIKPNIQELDSYERRFQNGIKNLFRILKDDGKIVFTFHNKNINIWNAFLNALNLSGFKVEKVIHQQNRRTGESNVANPYGTSASDFYIRCVKGKGLNVREEESSYQFEQRVLVEAIKLIGQRNEPTPYQILFNGLLAEISSAGFNIGGFDTNIERVLSAHVGSIFELKDNNNTQAGDYWWFKTPSDHIEDPDKQLSDRVEDTVVSLLRRNVSISFDEALGEVFIKYPNGLTPDRKSVQQILEKFADKSGGKWVYKGGSFEEDFTAHTEMLYLLSGIGRKMSYKIYIGKRERSDKYKDEKLSAYADLTNLSNLNLPRVKRQRVEMIDMLWVKDNEVKAAIEVENSTSFTSGIQRASNLEEGIKKIMVLPNKRESEFLSIQDPLFVEGFNKYNWGYLFYSDITRLKSLRNIDESDIDSFLRRFET